MLIFILRVNFVDYIDFVFLEMLNPFDEKMPNKITQNNIAQC